MSAMPLVTLAVPVRDGGPMLAAALDSIIGQDYPNLEVIVSDNCSTDETAGILADYAQRYCSIRVIRQPKPLTAIDNFMFLLHEAQGEFFAWCAHDDTRSRDFISGLLPAFEDPWTVLAFGDLYIWNGISPPERRDYDFTNVGLPRWQRLRKAAQMQCYHVYGLWRTSALRAIRYRYTHWWSDMPIILAAAATNQFRHIPGPQFIYFEIAKTDAERAAYQDHRAGASRLKDLAALFTASFITVDRTAGLRPALAATAFLAEKYLRQAIRQILKPKAHSA